MTRRVDTLNRFAIGCTFDGKLYSALLATKLDRSQHSAVFSVDDAVNLAAYLITCACVAVARTNSVEGAVGHDERGFPRVRNIMSEVRELVAAIEAP